MFSLIITIISIALVAALAIATIYYGGSAFTQGSAKSAASTLVAHAQQIAGANTLYANDNGGTFTNDVGGLVAGSYLASRPKSPNAADYQVDTSNVVTAALNAQDNICKQVNKSITGSETIGADSSIMANQQYGCYGTAGNAQTFFFKG